MVLGATLIELSFCKGMPPPMQSDKASANGQSTPFEGVSLQGLDVSFKTDCTMVEAGKSWRILTPHSKVHTK